MTGVVTTPIMIIRKNSSSTKSDGTIMMRQDDSRIAMSFAELIWPVGSVIRFLTKSRFSSSVAFEIMQISIAHGKVM